MKITQITNKDKEYIERYGLSLNKLVGCEHHSYESGEFVLESGKPLDYLYIVMDGTSKVFANASNGKDLVLCYYVSREILGDMELMLGAENADCTVVAVSNVEFTAIPIKENLTELKTNVKFLNKIGTSLSGKLLSSSKSFATAALYTGEERLCSYIMANARHGMFTEVLKDVAAATGLSYRHMFRILNKLCKEGILEKKESGYKVLSPDALEKKCCGK